jgi:hypothetical protein
MRFTQRDLDYIRAKYVTLEQAVHAAIELRVLPRPSYVLRTGRRWFRAADQGGA